VKPDATSWVSALDSTIKVCTETDSDGGDYWLRLDDSISGSAKAVGGNWGLRIALSNFVS